MPFNTLTVAAAVVPTVVGTWFSHYLNRKKRHEKPTAHISYDQSLNLTRKFLSYASHHTVEEFQHFTAPKIPSPSWVKVENIAIPEKIISSSADALISQLGEKGIEQVGGTKWWQWRGDSKSLKAEWIEMTADYNARKRLGGQCKRVMLYVHGGAYYFGSVDEHRYQIQRHARKLKARVLARLAPQFPFPCGPHDCLAAYLYLLTLYDPSNIILAGDSAGGGMVVSMLVTIRDQELPLPAGAILISPWVDLTHSFPSLVDDDSFDFLPAHGFMQRPSVSWPPPNEDELNDIIQEAEAEASQNKRPTQHEDQSGPGYSELRSNISSHIKNLTIELDDEVVVIKDQIHMYTTNQLLSHPLVSPVLQPSLGGLPPLLIVTGGGEVLRDEQIYLAHKAANPARYPPSDAHLDRHDPTREILHKYKPTYVQLQVWDDLCHVSTTFSFTRPAKYVYRSIAQFGAWALARAQKTEIDILDDDDEEESESSPSGIDNPSTAENGAATAKAGLEESHSSVGNAGDPLPPFHQHAILQRVDRHGRLYPLEDPSSLSALEIPLSEIGVIKPGPVRKWLEAKKQWDTKYASERRRVQKHRIEELIYGYERFSGDECPPPSALATRRVIDKKPKKKRKGYGLLLWSHWGSKGEGEKVHEREVASHEGREATIDVGDPDQSITFDTTSSQPRPVSSGRNKTSLDKGKGRSGSGSRKRVVTDTGQANMSKEDLTDTLNESEIEKSP